MTMPPICSVTIESSLALRIRALSQHLYELGPRPVYEWACEVCGASSAALDKLEIYSRIDPDVLHAIGGDVLPPVAVLVPRDQQ